MALDHFQFFVLCSTLRVYVLAPDGEIFQFFVLCSCIMSGVSVITEFIVLSILCIVFSRDFNKVQAIGFPATFNSLYCVLDTMMRVMRN